MDPGPTWLPRVLSTPPWVLGSSLRCRPPGADILEHDCLVSGATDHRLPALDSISVPGHMGPLGLLGHNEEAGTPLEAPSSRIAIHESGSASPRPQHTALDSKCGTCPGFEFSLPTSKYTCSRPQGPREDGGTHCLFAHSSLSLPSLLPGARNDGFCFIPCLLSSPGSC